MMKKLLIFCALALVSCAGHKENEIVLNSEEDLAGLRVAVATGSSYEMDLSSREDIQLLRFNTESDLLQALSNDRADVVVIDEVVFNPVIQRENGIKIALLGEKEFPTGFAFRGEDAALAQVMDLNPFFLMLPELLRPFAVILGAAAAVIASQALITGSYTLVSEAILLDLLPHLEIRYPSDTKGQLYIGTVNSLLWIGCSLVVLYFRSGARMESAYGLAITVTMLMTTLLLCVYLRDLRKKGLLAYLMLLVFGGIETIFFISSLSKFMHGGYVTVILTLTLLFLEIIWYRGTQLERKYSTRLKIRDHIGSLVALHNDPDIPLLAHNLVYLDGERDLELMDRDILYSILDKDTKRAQAYWFVNVHVLNEPKTMNYELETYGTDCVFRIRLNLGFKCSQRVNVYLRQIVHDL